MLKLFKRFPIYLIVFFVLFYTTNVQASTAYFVWEKTEIDVPVFSNIQDYKDKYILKLYVDGKLSDDYYVEMEVNCSTFSTVLTNKVGKYTVYYKAYSKSNYISSMVPIIFNVIDITPPNISLISNTIEVTLGSDLSTKNFYTISDDTCVLSDINVSINDVSVIYNTIGTYPASITATDLYGNSLTKKFNVKIVDGDKPQILILKPLEFYYGEDVNFTEYFLCKDNYNNDITYKMIVEGLDTSKLGRQEIRICIADYSNNMLEITVDVLVLDKIAPTLVLSSDEVVLDVLEFDTFNTYYFEGFIYHLSDNYSKEEDIQLVIDISKLKQEIADFNVCYTAIDENNNKKKEVLLVKIREFIGPTIIGEDVIEVTKGSNIDLWSLVTVIDEYDLDAYQRLSVNSGDFDIDKAGSYEIVYTCFNTSGIFSEKIIVINVVDDTTNGNTNTTEKNNLETLEIIKILVISLSIVISSLIIMLGIIKKKKNNK